MIPTAYHIVLILTGAHWSWHVEDDEMNAVAHGKTGDYQESAAAALVAFDELRRKEAEARL
jgi:hypothetical protein